VPSPAKYVEVLVSLKWLKSPKWLNPPEVLKSPKWLKPPKRLSSQKWLSSQNCCHPERSEGSRF
jgi:hypothetical protein